MRIDHVGIAVESIDRTIPFYEQALGLVVSHREDVPSQKVKVAFLKDPKSADSEAQVELLEPTGDGAISKFLQARGPGMHHIAFHSQDIAKSMKHLKDKGRPPLEDAPRPGSRGHKVCFLHPKHADGVLVELVG